MTEHSDTPLEEPLASLVEVFDDPTGGRRRLPSLLGLLDDDQASVRLGAAWAACHVAAIHPDTVAYLTRRLLDRIEGEEPSVEAELVFEYLQAQYPEGVIEEIQTMEAEKADRPRPRQIDGSLARSDFHRPEIGNRGVGRTRLAGAGEAGPQRVHTNEARDTDRLHRPGDDDSDGADSSDGSAGDADDGGAVGTGTGTGRGGPAGPAREGPWQPADDLSSIAYGRLFDQLTVLAKRRRGRYADVYRTLGVLNAQQLPVGLALYHRPSEHETAFSAAIGDQLAKWAGLSHHDNVVRVHDWGIDPRPWAATEYMEYRLAERDQLDLSDALWNARELASGLVYLHENGVIHGGLDPGNVVYSGNIIEEDEAQPPLLTNVGLLQVVRNYFDPTYRLDPRYAAPEYFARRFGRIDHATDVYQLGAVLYRLFTGNHPYDGDYDRIRERVMKHPAPRPSDVADVPARIDDVVTKAMASQKLRRYETVRHMQQELRGVRSELGDNGG